MDKSNVDIWLSVHKGTYTWCSLIIIFKHSWSHMWPDSFRFQKALPAGCHADHNLGKRRHHEMWKRERVGHAILSCQRQKSGSRMYRQNRGRQCCQEVDSCRATNHERFWHLATAGKALLLPCQTRQMPVTHVKLFQTPEYSWHFCLSLHGNTASYMTGLVE